MDRDGTRTTTGFYGLVVAMVCLFLFSGEFFFFLIVGGLVGGGIF